MTIEQLKMMIKIDMENLIGHYTMNNYFSRFEVECEMIRYFSYMAIDKVRGENL